MKILVSGSHGLVGKALIKSLTRDGHDVVALVRSVSRSHAAAIAWDPAGGKIDLTRLEGFDGVVHLAGESIASGRWTTEKKRRIRESRERDTRLLAEGLAQLKQPPRVLASASAIGYYGDRAAELLTEESAPGTDFLAEVCVAWEKATVAAAEKGIRVVNLRFGVILSATGGALAKMLPPFRMGVGGRVGDGKQFMSWITLLDAVRAIRFALEHEELHGPVNVVSPEPVTNAEFTKTLGRALSRPTLFPIPAFGLRLVFGETADAILLASQRVEPMRLHEAGFEFKSSELKVALLSVLGPP
jgi:uncharacterized protein